MKILFLYSIAILAFLTFESISISAQNPTPDKALSFSFNRFYQKNNHRFVECTIRNTTDTTFWINAYELTNEDETKYIFPIYDLFEKKENLWRNSGLGFDGTGLTPHKIGPGTSILFETAAYDSTADAIKIGVDVRTNLNVMRAAREIWTNEIPLR